MSRRTLSRSSDETGLLLAQVQPEPLSVDQLLKAVSHSACGGVVIFIGVVRDHDGGQEVTSLDYTAHPTAERLLDDVGRQVSARHTRVRLAVAHRTGRLTVGDSAVVVAAAAAHRDDAFAACRDLIDTLKADVPIWKYQSFRDGSTEWVGS